MPVLKRNHRAVAAAQPIADKRTRYRVEGVTGLWLDLTPKGRRTWYVRYQRAARGTRTFRWYRIGDASSIGLAQATQCAREIIASVYVEGRDPHLERATKTPAGVTFADLFQSWYERHAKPHLARAETDHYLYTRYLKDRLAELPVSEIKRQKIGLLRDELARMSGPTTSNHVLALINRIYNWSVDEGLIELNPANRLRKIAAARPRERVLSANEIHSFWHALDTCDTLTGEHIARGERGRILTPETRAILRIILLTGQRRAEVTGIKKDELDLESAEPTWTLPGARTKNGLLHRVPLCNMAADVFRVALAASPSESPYVFASPTKPEMTISPNAVTRAMARLTAEIGIKGASPHDLRRTVGTEMARLGLPSHVRARVLNHSPRANNITDAVYNRYAYDNEKREAFQRWEEHLQMIIQSPAHNLNEEYREAC